LENVLEKKKRKKKRKPASPQLVPPWPGGPLAEAQLPLKGPNMARGGE